jgi:hypothetical protein
VRALIGWIIERSPTAALWFAMPAESTVKAPTLIPLPGVAAPGWGGKRTPRCPEHPEAPVVERRLDAVAATRRATPAQHFG